MGLNIVFIFQENNSENNFKKFATAVNLFF